MREHDMNPCANRWIYIAAVAGEIVQCVIINKSDDKKTVRSRVEDSAVDYWAVHVGGTKNNNKHFYTMIKWF